MNDPYDDQLEKLYSQSNKLFKVVKVSQELKLLPNGNIVILKNQENNIIYYNDVSDISLPIEFKNEKQVKYEGQINFLESVPLNQGKIESPNVILQCNFYKGFVNGQGEIRLKKTDRLIVCSFEFSQKHGQYFEENETQKIYGYYAKNQKYGKFTIENKLTKEKTIKCYENGTAAITNSGVMRLIAFDSQNSITNYILYTLEEGKWINEIIIDFYFQLVKQYQIAQNKFPADLQILDTLQTQNIFSSLILNSRDINFVALKQIKQEGEIQERMIADLKAQQVKNEEQVIEEKQANRREVIQEQIFQQPVQCEKILIYEKKPQINSNIKVKENNKFEGKQQTQNGLIQLQNAQRQEFQPFQNTRSKVKVVITEQNEKSEHQLNLENVKIQQNQKKIQKDEKQKQKQEKQEDPYQQNSQEYGKIQENQVKLDGKKKYILAINVNRCHFVILYYRNHQLHLLNSMNDKTDQQLLKNVSQIFEDGIQLKLAKVTQQSNGYDCGIHAIYNFLQLIKMKEGEENLDFKTTKNKINQLRSHLTNVIINRHAHILPLFKN